MTAYIEKSFHGRTFRVLPESSAIVDDAEPMLDRLRDVKPGDVFVDVGAGHGTYALRASAMGAHVIAFEPHAPTMDILSRNVVETCASAVTVSDVALWDDTPYPEDLWREVWGRHYPMPESWRPTTQTLDSLGLPRLDWLKLDVEGAELGVLQGAAKTLKDQRPTLLIEDHDGISSDPNCVVSRYAERIGSSTKIRAMLGDLGYRIEVLPWGCGRRFIVAEHPSRKLPPEAA